LNQSQLTAELGNNSVIFIATKNSIITGCRFFIPRKTGAHCNENSSYDQVVIRPQRKRQRQPAQEAEK
jgi:hypothetical protein